MSTLTAVPAIEVLTHFRFSGLAACGADDRRRSGHGTAGTSDPAGPITCPRCTVSFLLEEVRVMDAHALAVECPMCLAAPGQRCLREPRTGIDGTPDDPGPHLSRLRVGAMS